MADEGAAADAARGGNRGRLLHIVDDDEVPPTRFAPARGARLAYQVFGSGPHTVVAIPPLAQNIELAWERPEIRRMLRRFGTFCRYLAFDKRGTGCSDRRSRVADIDERVDDVRAVMDHAGIDHAHLFGSSEGGPMTLLFAATYPQRVDSVILFGSGASLYPADLADDEVARYREAHVVTADRWGTPDSTIAQRFAPSIVADDPTFVAWHQRYERFAASPESLRDLLELGLHMDARDLLPTIMAPTLVIHRQHDRSIPLQRGEEVARGLPNARLFAPPGEDHFAYAGDVDVWMDEFERFITGEIRSRPSVRSAHTVRISTLGRFAVTVDGHELPAAAWGSRHARQLCKRLVAARGWPVTRDELFDLLWPDETDRRRLGPRLSVQLSTLRRVLGGGVIADRASVRLDISTIETDLDAFHRARSDTAIVAAYTGSFLPDDQYEAWTDAVRTAVDARFALAARRLVVAARDRDDLDTAATLCHRLIEVDRYDDHAHELLVAVLLRAGAVGQARRAHDRRTTTMAELAIEVPAFDTRRQT